MINHKNLSHLSYRPDIDGIRALAVSLVIAFHTFPNFLCGGFIGVDIFFVISGYLITSIIYINLDNDSFSFKEFYFNRIKRIFPALILVLFFCYICGWFLLLAEEFTGLGRHIAFGTGFASNLLLLNESGYFDTTSDLKPLLHLWSLGVEEQFYLIWPLALWVISKTKKNSLLPIGLIVCISFAVNLFLIKKNPIEAFYSPIPRFWELLIGAILANLELYQNKIYKNLQSNYSNTAAIAGISLILLSLVLLNKDMAFPGYWAILPVFGSALLIMAKESIFNKKILSLRGLVGIGLISYPLYLWHWPILSFGKILYGDELPNYTKLILILVVLFVAYITYEKLEKPLRRFKRDSIKVGSLILVMIIIGFLGFNTYSRNGYSFRYKKMVALHLAYLNNRDYTSLGSPISTDNSNDECTNYEGKLQNISDSFCHETTAEPTLAVIGDSHTNHLFYGLKNSTSLYLNQVVVLGAGGCLPIQHVSQSEHCNEQAKINLKVIEKKSSINSVIISAESEKINDANSVESEAYLKDYQDLIDSLVQMNKKVVFLIDTPKFKESPENCAHNPFYLREVFKKETLECEFTFEKNVKTRYQYGQFINELRNQNPKVTFFDASSIFCNAVNCKVLKDGILIFRDTNHLTEFGSTTVIKTLETEFK